MKIEVLGTGCKKCTKLYEAAIQAVEDAGVSAQVVKVESINEILDRGIMLTPGLIIDGDVVSSGKLLKAEAIAELLKARGA
jgi:small redox-active disulfide protein 2